MATRESEQEALILTWRRRPLLGMMQQATCLAYILALLSLSTPPFPSPPQGSATDKCELGPAEKETFVKVLQCKGSDEGEGGGEDAKRRELDGVTERGRGIQRREKMVCRQESFEGIF